jgi:hypothetical protein
MQTYSVHPSDGAASYGLQGRQRHSGAPRSSPCRCHAMGWASGQCECHAFAMRMYEGISTLQRVESKRLANAMQMPCSRPNSCKGQGLARARQW